MQIFWLGNRLRALRGASRLPHSLGVALAGAAILCNSSWANCTQFVPVGGNIQAALHASGQCTTGIPIVTLGPGIHALPGTLILPAHDVILVGAPGAILVGNGTFPLIEIGLGNSTSTVIRNLTLKAGGGAAGGAIRVLGGSRPTLRNLSFSTNSGAFGGAVYIDLSVTGPATAMRVDRCTFVSNSASEGGAVYIHNFAELSDSVLDVSLRHCTFFDNEAIDLGGAVAVTQAADVDIEACLFEDNTATAGHGGGIAVYSDRFGNGPGSFWQSGGWHGSGNGEGEGEGDGGSSGGGGGGGGWGGSGGFPHEICPSMRLMKSALQHNSAAENGGSVYVRHGLQFLAHTVTSDGGSASLVGGGLYFDAHLMQYPEVYDLRNMLVVRGVAHGAGGLAVWGADVSLTHATFNQNQANYAGAVAAYGGTIALTHSILWGDSSSNPAHNEYGSSAFGPEYGQLVFNDCDVQGGVGGLNTTVTGVLLSADPQWATGYACTFVPVTGYFLNQATSPCLNLPSAPAPNPTFNPYAALDFFTDPSGALADMPLNDMGFHAMAPTCP